MSRTGHVRVSFRLRPMNKDEQKEERYGCVKVNQERARVSIRNDGTTKHFNFDKVFDEHVTQAIVYKESVAPLVADFLSGRNCCILAYGEQGSGKTFTMNGPRCEEEDGDRDDDLSSIGSAGVSRYNGQGRDYVDVVVTKLPGQVITGKSRNKVFSVSPLKPHATIANQSQQLDVDEGMIPRVVHELFDKIRKIKKANPKKEEEHPVVRFSFFDISNEKIIDLLEHSVEVGNEQPLSVRNDREKGIYVEKATEKTCSKATELMDYIQSGILRRAERIDRIGSSSAQSHAVFMIQLERFSRSKGKRTKSSLFLVDLANSALVRKPPPDADSLLVKEAKSIKRSLGALRKCLRAIALNDRSVAPPFGESVLTKLLHDSISRGAGVSMIVTANPLSRSVNESLSAVRFGIYVSGQRDETSDESVSHCNTAETRNTHITSLTPASKATRGWDCGEDSEKASDASQDERKTDSSWHKEKEPSVNSSSQGDKEPSLNSTSQKGKEPSVNSPSRKVRDPSLHSASQKEKEPSVSSSSQKEKEREPSVNSLSHKGKEPSIHSASQKEKDPSVNSASQKEKQPSVHTASQREKEPSVNSASQKERGRSRNSSRDEKDPIRTPSHIEIDLVETPSQHEKKHGPSTPGLGGLSLKLSKLTASSERFEHDNQTDDGMTLQTDDGSGIFMRPTYEELNAASEMLKNFTEGSPAPNGNHDTGQNLAQVSTLLENASRRMEADMNEAKKELEATGQKAMTRQEMESELAAVTKELERLKYSGHLSHQLQKEVLSTQEELRKLASSNHSSPSRPAERVQRPEVDNRGSLPAYLGRHHSPISPYHDHQSMGTSTESTRDERSRTTQESEFDQLLEEMEQLKEENERLARESVDRDEDLAKAEIEIMELRSKVSAALAAAAAAAAASGPVVTAAASYDDVAKTMDFSKPPRTSTTSVTTEMSESAMTNMVGRNFDIDKIKEENDPWDEPDEDIGPAPIAVYLRLRPMTKLELNRRSRSCIEVHEGDREFTVDSPLDGEYDFSFDHVFDVDSSQEDVYETVGVSIVDSLLQGINCSVMAYGLSGSGKTHTLTGKLPELADDRSEDLSSDEDSISTDATPKGEDAGFLPRVLSDLFHGMKDHPEYIEFRLTCNYVAIFLEKIYDLLDPKLDKTLLVKDTTFGITIEGAIEAFCFDKDDIIQLIRRGTACRKLIGDKLNIDPNRSHAIFILHMEQRHVRSGAVRRSYLQLSELAGFEVTSKAKGQSVQETKIIHKSFSALGNVIKCLTEGNPYAPYREAKLTSILKDAFGGNCRAALFITASPSSYNISETINSIRLGQRVKRVTNKPRMNKDAGIDDYRKWLLETEMKFGELSGLVQEFAKDLVQENQRHPSVKKCFSSSMWQTILAIAEEEESVHNPCRKALILGEDEDQFQSLPKWRLLSVELAKRRPSEKLIDAIRGRDRAESLLSDIQSESVVLRRQNELLVQEKRKKEDELGNAHSDNRKITLKNSELEHKLSLTENRSKEAINFLRYMRALCWQLRRDIEKDRPITITEITSTLAGAPDLSGLVDLDSLLVDAGIIESSEVDLDKVEGEFFDYLEQAGLVIPRADIQEDEEEVDELAGLDDGINGEDGHNNRWVRRAATTTKTSRPATRDDQSIISRGNVSIPSVQAGEPSLFGMVLPWKAKKEESVQEKYEPRASNTRNSRREQELQRDLKSMGNKVVELQIELQETKLLMDSICSRSGDLQKKKLAQEAISLAKERDRMMHNAKAAAWKLQELHVVNKMLSKLSSENKQQVAFLEEGFQRLQESFRGTVKDGLDADAELRERAKYLQAIVDSLTGSVEDGSEDERNLFIARVHLPIRGKIKPTNVDSKLVDPSSPDSQVRCLILKYKGKRMKKTPVASVHHKGKWRPKKRQTGTAIIGRHRELLTRAYEIGKALTLPSWLDDDEDESFDSNSLDDSEEDDISYE